MEPAGSSTAHRIARHVRHAPRLLAASGLTLVEVLLALLVCVIAGLGVLGAYQTAMHLTEVTQQTTVALNDLKDIMEQIKATPFTLLVTNFPAGTLDATTGQGIVGGYTLNGEQIAVAYPNPGTNPLEIVITVNWTNRNRSYSRSAATFRAS